MTEHYNVDITIAAENGADETQIKDAVRGAVDASETTIDHCALVSKVEEVKKQ